MYSFGLTLFRFASLFVVVIVLVVAAHSSAFAYKGERLAGSATVTMQEATAIAMHVRSGKIIERELEREAGGTGMRYSFIIKNGSRKYEVGVDAKNGKVLENKVEGKHPD